MATYDKVKNVVLGVTAVTTVVACAYSATNLFNKEKDYSDILVESAKKYVEENNLAIESQLVTSASRLKESGALVKDLKDECVDGSYVTVTNEDGTYKYEPSLVCQTKETTSDETSNSSNSTVAVDQKLTYTVNTSSKKLTNANVEVQVVFSEEIHNVSVQGWTLSSDKKTLTKIFTENAEDEFQAVSLDGTKSVMVKISASNIDKDAPIVLANGKNVISNYADGVNLSIDDDNLESVKVNGEDVESYSINKTGDYEVVATDLAGNKTVAKFALSNRETVAPPVINSITDGKIYTALPVRVTFSGAEATLYKNNGSTVTERQITSGSSIREAGKYTLTVKNSVGDAVTVNFLIDTDFPLIWAETEDGGTLQNGKTTNKKVKVYFSDKYSNVTAKSNNLYRDLKYGEEFSNEGSYTITATDEAGQKTQFSFTIDKTIPTVSGVVDGKYYSSNRTIFFDSKGGTVTAKLDGKEISSGHTVTDEGNYRLVVSSTAGNSNTINFGIDKTKPTFEGFSATQDTVVTKNSFEVKANDAHLKSLEIKNGSETISGTTLTDEGIYTLIATDEANNRTTKTVKIDKTAPSVTVGDNDPIIGVGAIEKAFEGDVSFSIEDMTDVTVKVDGKAFTGNTVTANGRHSLEVTDAVGNQSIVYFTIAKDVPEVKLISNGNEIIADNELLTHYFNKDVTIKISNNVEIKSAILTAPDGDTTLTQDEILNGKTIKATYGLHKEYKLVVVDAADRTITVNFVVDRKSPTSSVVSSTYSTDQTITFSDMSGAVTATLDGKTIENGTVLSKEGTHTLILTDKLGNSVVYYPVIDKSAPKVTIDGKLFSESELNNTIYFNKEVTVSLEDTYSSISVSVNGETREVSATTPQIYSETLSENGEYKFVVTDKVRHTTKFTVVINTTKPVGVITKENIDDKTTDRFVDSVKMTLTLDENYTISDSNNLVWELVKPSAVEGKVQYTYTLIGTLSGTVTLTNNVGNSINVPYDVVIDKDAPTASVEYSKTTPISGDVEIYLYTNEPVTFTDTLTWSEGVLVTEEGIHKGQYKYTATAEENVEKDLDLFDANNNKTTIEYKVENIDKKVDLIGNDTTGYFTYSNNGTATNQPVTVTLKAYEKLTFSDTVLTWSAPVVSTDENGKDVYTYTATASDNYTNTLLIKDDLNNEISVTYKVTGIDTEGPKVEGFDEDKYNKDTKSYLFNTNVTPTFTEGTAKLKKKNASGNYETYIENFTSGTQIGGTELIDETYRLEVTDGVNTTVKDFRIDKIAPTATYTLSKTESNQTIVTVNAGEYITVTTNASDIIYLTGHEGFTYTFDEPEVITFSFKDEAGNVGSIEVDAVAPVVEGIIDGGKYATTETEVTITDNKRGVSATLDGTTITGTEVESGFKFKISDILGTTGNGETHTLVVTDAAGNSITYTFTIDTISPIISGVENRKLYNSTVYPEFNEGTATLVRKYTELVDTELVEKTETITNFVSKTAVSEDGLYTLTVTDGITTPTEYTFEIDKTMPTIISSDIETSNGKEYTNGYVTVTLQASEAIDMTSTHDLIEVSEDKKTYRFKVSVNGEVTFSFKDKAENTGSKTVNVQQIDKNVPTISGVKNEGLYSAKQVPLTITFTDDKGIESATIIGGKFTEETQFISGNSIRDEGTYTLVVTDIADNATTYTFEVDKTAPEVTLPSGGVTVDGKLLYNKDVKPEYTEGTGILKKKVNGAYVKVTTYDKEVAISENGEYRLTVSDLAGNETIKEFTIDKATPNVVSITADITAPTKENVTLTIVLDKAVTMNTPYSSVSADRTTYTVTASANGTVNFQFRDDAGNANTASFTVNNIDRKCLTGVITADTNPVKGSLVLTLTVPEPIKNIDTDLWHKVETTGTNTVTENPANSTPAPDQTPVSYTREVTINGEYTVTYTDMAGNPGSATYIVSNVDTGAPTIEIVEGTSLPDYTDIYTDTVKVKVKDQNLKAITYTLNGEEQEPIDLEDYANGEIIVPFSEDGKYVINAVDDFEQNAQPITFTIDTQEPSIGIVKGEETELINNIYNGKVTVNITDLTLDSITYTVNEIENTVKVQNGTWSIDLGTDEMTEATYKFTATDKAGNPSSIEFKIDTKDPEITGFEHNKKYKDSVTVNVTDANLSSVTYTGPTESESGTFESEHTFEEAGTYTIVAKDYANNTTTKTFTIDKTTPELLSIKSMYMAEGQKYTNMATDILVLTFNKPVKLNTTSPSWVDKDGNKLSEEARKQYSDTLYFKINTNFTLNTTFEDELKNTGNILYVIDQFYREAPVINVNDVIIVNKKNVDTFILPVVTGSTTNSEVNVTVSTENTFDKSQLEQVVTYNAVDAAGNTASKDVTIRVIDTEELDTIKSNLSKLHESDYTEISWANKKKLITDLESAIAGTNENVDLKNVTQDYVNSKIKEIKSYQLVAKGLDTTEFEKLQDKVSGLVKSDYIASEELETLWTAIQDLAATDTSTIDLQSSLTVIENDLKAKLAELEGMAIPVVLKNQEYRDSFKEKDYSNREAFYTKLDELANQVADKTIKLQSEYNKEVEKLETKLIKNPIVDTDLVKAEEDFAKLVLTDYTTTSYNRLKTALENARTSVTNPGLISVYEDKMAAVASAQNALEVIPKLIGEPILTGGKPGYAKLGDTLSLEFESNVELNLELSETNRFVTAVTINGKTASVRPKEGTETGKYVYVATVTVEADDQERLAPYTILLASVDQVVGTTVGKTSDILVDRTPAEAKLTVNPGGQTPGPVRLTLKSGEAIIITGTAKKEYSKNDEGKDVVTIIPTSDTWTPVGTEGKEYYLDINENRSVVVYFTDAAGNPNSKEIDITNIDKDAPTIEIKADITEATNKDVVLTIVASEPLKSMIIDGTVVTGTDDTYTYTVKESKIVTIQFEDFAGNKVTETYDATYIDKTPAVIGIPVYSNKGALTNEEVTITITSSEKITFENKTLVDGNKLEWTEIPVKDANENIVSYKYEAVADANYEGSFTVLDHVGNPSVFSYKVTGIDTVKPNVGVTYKTADGNEFTEGFTNQDVTVTITSNKKLAVISDGNDEHNWLGSEKEVTGGYEYSLTFSSDVESTTLTIKDEAGNAPEETVTYSITGIDKDKPNIKITANGNLCPGGIVYGTVDVEVKDTNLKSITYVETINGVSETKTVKFENGVGTITLGDNDDTEATYEFTAVDKANNSNSFSFSIDTKVPVITGIEDDETTKDNVNIAVIDANLSKVTYTGPVSGTFEGTTHKFTVSGTYTVTATDYAGNTSSKTFTIDNTPAVIGAPVYSNNGKLTTDDVTITITSSEKITFKGKDTLVDEKGLKWTETAIKDENENIISYKYEAVADDNYEASFTVLDPLGNESTFSYKVTGIDRLLPELEKIESMNMTEGQQYTNIKVDILKLTFNKPVKLNTTSASWVNENGVKLTDAERQQYHEVLYFKVNVNFNLKTTFSDELGREETLNYKIVQFDRGLPEFTSEINSLYGKDINLPVTFTDEDLVSDSANGKIVSDGNHTVTAKLLDAEGQEIATIENGNVIKYKASEDAVAQEGEILVGSGKYTIVLTDKAGNTTSKEFEVDADGPDIEVSPKATEEDGTYIGPVNVVVTDKNGLTSAVLKAEGKEDVVLANGKGTITDGGTYTIVATDTLGNESTTEFTVAEPPKVVSIRSTVMGCDLLEGQQYTNAKMDTLILEFNRPVVLETKSSSLVDENGISLKDRETARTKYYFRINVNFNLTINIHDENDQTGKLYYEIRQFDRGLPKFTSEIESLYGKDINLPVTFTDEDLASDSVSGKPVTDNNHTVTAKLLDAKKQEVATINNGNVIKYKASEDAVGQEGEILVGSGKYTIVLTDKAGNTTSKEFEIVDNGPEIILPKSVVEGKNIYKSPITPEYEGIAVLEKMVDGSYKEVSYTKGTPISSGEYKLTVTDTVGNSNSETFKVYAEGPAFGTYEPKRVTIKGTSLTIDNPVAIDALNNELTSEIEDIKFNGESLGKTGTIDYTQAGTYEIIYSVTDEATNNETATVTIIVLDIDAFNSLKKDLTTKENAVKDAEGNIISIYDRVNANKDDYTESSWNARKALIDELDRELSGTLSTTIDQTYIDNKVQKINEAVLVSNGVDLTEYNKLVATFNGLDEDDYDKEDYASIEEIINNFDTENIDPLMLQSTFNKDVYLPLKADIETLMDNPSKITLVTSEDYSNYLEIDYSYKADFLVELEKLANKVASNEIKLQSEYDSKVQALEEKLIASKNSIDPTELNTIKAKYVGKEDEYTNYNVLDKSIENAEKLLPDGLVSDFEEAMKVVRKAEEDLILILNATDINLMKNGDVISTGYAKIGDTLSLSFNTNAQLSTDTIVTIDGITATLTSSSNEGDVHTYTYSIGEILANNEENRQVKYTIKLIADKAESKIIDETSNVIIDSSIPEKLGLTYTTGTIETAENGGKYVTNETTLPENYKTNQNVIIKLKTTELLENIIDSVDGHNWFEIAYEDEEEEDLDNPSASSIVYHYYRLEVSADTSGKIKLVDKAGNESEEIAYSVQGIDKVKPNVGVTYKTADGKEFTEGFTNQDVTVTITSSEKLAVISDGNNEHNWLGSEHKVSDTEYTYSLTFSSDVELTTLTIEDEAGNAPEEAVTYSITGIDKQGPKIIPTINGDVYAGGFVNGSVNFVVKDTNLESITYTVNGGEEISVPFENGEGSITFGNDKETEGTYEVTATDKANNSTSFGISIDTKAPVIEGITNGQTTEEDVTITVTDANIKEVTYTGPVSGTFEGTEHTFTEDGTYTVIAKDVVDNITEITFTIDQNASVISGVENGGKYSVAPTITFKGTATLNGETFTSGSKPNDGKNQKLIVTSPTGTVTEITFTVDTVDPTIVTKPGVYKSVTIEYSDETTIPTGMIGNTLVANGSTFSEEGTHTLVVTDEVGNHKEVTFTIDNTAPTLEITDNKGNKHTTDFEVTLEVDKVNKFTNFAYTATDREGVDVTVDITGSVDLSIKGDYELVYKATDDVSNATTITVTVHVKDTTVPVIAMNEPDKDIEVKYGTVFTDPYGAVAVDAFDGVVNVTSTNNVNIYQVGTYKVTYTAIDASGNKATAERTVNVISADTGELFRTANKCREGTQCYGSYSPNNYVWYSGHLWRVIKVNPDNTLKLIAEDAASGFSFDDNSSAFAESNAEKWLNNVFYPSLNNADTIVTTGDFCNEQLTSFSTVRYTCSASSVVKSKVGLLTIDEYNILSGQNGFLNNGTQFFTMTPTSEDTAWVVNSDGTKERAYYVTEPFAMRPVININRRTVLSGKGTEADPFIIDEGSKSVAGSKLNTALSGEYVNFGGKKWRIVSSSNEGTKLITDDYVKVGNSYVSQAFGTAGVFNTASGIGYYLNNTIYNEFSTTEKTLIKLSRWYNNEYVFGQNPINTTLVPGSKYTDAYVGLIRVGELMSGSTSSTVKANNLSYWTLNNNGTNSWYVKMSGASEISLATDLRGIRPVITLAENVVIADGDGTQAHPYELKY